MKQLTPRKFDRDLFLKEVQVRPLRGCGPFQAHTLDLGESGMGLFAGRFLEVGQAVEILFPASGTRILGSVANARVESDGNILGIAFARPLDESELQSLKQAPGVDS